jgi:AraC-like DNA-binding protein
VEEDGYDTDQETIDGTLELLEGVERESRSLRIIAGCAAFSQLRIDTNYSPEEDYLTQRDVAECFGCSRTGLRETYTDVLGDSNTRQVEDVWLISR